MSTYLHQYFSGLLLVTIWVTVTTNSFLQISSYASSFYELHKLESLAPTLTTVYFYWLDLTLLPLLFTILVLVVLFITTKRIYITFLHLAIVLVISLLTTINEAWGMNLTTNLCALHYHNVNSFLLNSLNKYHPLIFYVSALTALLLAWISFTNTLTTTLFQSIQPVHLEFHWRGGILFLNGLSLFLGSWWALQEWTWGGWWNWDPSETFGLGVSFIVLCNAHASLNYWDVLSYRTKSALLGTWFVGSYFLVQLNFEILSHNFGLDSFLFFNKNLHLVYVGFLLAMFYRRNKWNQLNALRPASSSRVSVLHSEGLIIMLLIVIPVVLSYWPIATFLLWKFTTFNGATTVVIPLAIFLILGLLLKESLFKENETTVSKVWPIFLIAATPLNSWYVHVSKQKMTVRYVVTHIWLLLLLLTNCNAVGQDFFSWMQPQKNNYLVSVSNYLHSPSIVTSYNTYSTETCVLWRDTRQNNFFQQLVTTLHKSTIVDFYPLIAHDSTFYNFQSVVQARYTPTLTTYLHNLTNLTFGTLLGAAALGYVLRRPIPYGTSTNF